MIYESKMKNRLQSITIKGFKSIRNLRDFPLNSGLNVFIGANGAGKSNFIELFKLLEMWSLNGLNEYVTQMGGADTFLFQGAETTAEIEVKLDLSGQSCNEYQFSFIRTVENRFMETTTTPFFPNSQSFNVPLQINDDPWAAIDKADAFLYEALKGWRVYNFQNTTTFSPLRKEASIYNNKEFLTDGSNLPAFLLDLQRTYQNRVYSKIRTAVRQIMPIFDDFVLTPIEHPAINDSLVRLCWRQKGSRYLFQPWQMSDGTLRFLALTVALLQPNPPATMVIDEPELGLHPASLTTLSGFMHEAAFNSQLIVTTQSPDLLNTMEPEDIITVNMNNGESVFNRLSRVDLANWLEDYAIGDLWWKNVIQAGPTYV
jgi:predicted ATPase